MCAAGFAAYRVPLPSCTTPTRHLAHPSAARYESGHEGDSFLVGFSPRKQNLTLYIMTGLDPHEALLSKLGKHKTGKSCLYINTLDDIDVPTLRELIQRAFTEMKKRK